jgi:hypothetical protein
MPMGTGPVDPDRRCSDMTSAIRAAIQSKKAIPSNFLISGEILKMLMLRMSFSRPTASRPLKATRATRNVEPPTSSAKNSPLSCPVGRRWLYDGSIDSACALSRCRNWNFSCVENFLSWSPSVGFKNNLSAPSRKALRVFTGCCIEPLRLSAFIVDGRIQNAKRASRNDRPRRRDLSAANNVFLRLAMAMESGLMNHRQGLWISGTVKLIGERE